MYILTIILFVTSQAGTSLTQEYGNKQACEAAMDSIKKSIRVHDKTFSFSHFSCDKKSSGLT